MRLYILFINLVIIGYSKKHNNKSAEENKDVPYVDRACGAYEKCLSVYDQTIASCGNQKNKQHADDDTCYVPIEKNHEELMKKKDRRSQLLRQCYVTGSVDTVDGEDLMDITTGKDGLIGEHHQITCGRKIGEFDLFLDTYRAKEKGKKTTRSQCRAAAKRFKERCSRIESCCIRVKICRLLVARHPMVDSMKELEEKIKEDRRTCRETI